ncbi:MAG: aggregation factor core [Shimia sp.]|uniref:aggregation factor core n=1 Tax=Shimia sp. TaxID=1954381 RepID=UPI004059EF5F
MFRVLNSAFAAFVFSLLATMGHADLSVRFVEGAPKDRFEIKNVGACALTASTIQLDLSTSRGALIFDVSNSGAGVEVFQPFEVVSGQDAFAEMPSVVDGQNAVDLKISKLNPGANIAFTIDVDDTLGAREITVTGSEIAGATVTQIGTDGRTTAQFDSQARAQVADISCERDMPPSTH